MTAFSQQGEKGTLHILRSTPKYALLGFKSFMAETWQ